jgi:hypothetical protein
VRKNIQDSKEELSKSLAMAGVRCEDYMAFGKETDVKSTNRKAKKTRTSAPVSVSADPFLNPGSFGVKEIEQLARNELFGGLVNFFVASSEDPRAVFPSRRAAAASFFTSRSVKFAWLAHEAFDYIKKPLVDEIKAAEAENREPDFKGKLKRMVIYVASPLTQA